MWWLSARKVLKIMRTLKILNECSTKIFQSIMITTSTNKLNLLFKDYLKKPRLSRIWMLYSVDSTLRTVTFLKLVNQTSFLNLFRKNRHASTVQPSQILICVKDASQRDNKFTLRKGNKFSKWTNSTKIIGKNAWIVKDQTTIKFCVGMRTVQFFIEE